MAESEPLSLNSNKINQMAKRRLTELGVSADPMYLYSLQLARQALEEGTVSAPAGQFRATMLDRIDLMFGMSPKRAMRLLVIPDEEEDETEAAESLAARSDPKRSSLGPWLAENLWINLSETDPELMLLDGQE
jgi:hypothetical protein